MKLLLDTHTLAWFGAGSSRMSSSARAAIEAMEAELFVSAVTAWEYADLQHRGRMPDAAPLSPLQDMLDFALLDFPADLWSFANRLPSHHRDPVDRMLVAHAIAADMTLVTADKTIRRYPVKTLW